MTDTVAFQDERPDLYLLSQIYDPDDPENSGSIIPTIPSLVCKAPGSTVWYSVVAVDAETHKTTLEPISTLLTNGEDDTSSIIDYNNSRFHIFYDDRVSPVKLVIDSLFLVTGTSNVEYILKRVSPDDGEEETVSVYYDSNGNYTSNRIPFKVDSNTGVRYCSNCHTNLTVEDNDLITMEIYDQAGTQTAEVTFFAKRATILNDLDTDPIITDFQLNTYQVKDDLLYVYVNQDVSQLLLEPTLVYNDGTKKIVTIDNDRCFLYGLDELITSHPGLKQTVLCKYFLLTTEQAQDAIDDRHGRYVYVEKDIIVLPKTTMFTSKLSVIPRWDATLGRYTLRFFLYTSDRDSVYDVTDIVTYVKTFDGTNVNSEQQITVSVQLQDLFQLDDPLVYVQNFWIRLKPYSNVERYIIKDTANDDYAYGVDSVLTRRPVIHYDSDLEQYFIPTSVFENKEAVIESFYTRIHPLYDPNDEVSPPTPTHFTIRDAVTKNTIIPVPIPIDQYEQAWSIVTSGSSDAYVGNSVVVEFLVYSSQYLVVFGVPVDVKESETGYNV